MSTNPLTEYNENLLAKRLASNDDRDKIFASRSPYLKEVQQLQLVAEGKAAIISTLLMNTKITSNTLHAIVEILITENERFNKTFVTKTLYRIITTKHTRYETYLLIAQSKVLAKTISYSNDFLYSRLAITYRKELTETVSQQLNIEATSFPVDYLFKILNLNVNIVR